MATLTQIITLHFETREIRILVVDGQSWFCATDICAVLGYANSRKAVKDNCLEAGVTVSDISSGGQMRRVAFVSEGSLYRLIIKSRKEEAQQFESWVCNEVLPSIRKTSEYGSKALHHTQLDHERVKQAHLLASEATSTVFRTVFDAVMAGDEMWQHDRWALSFDHEGRASAWRIDSDALICSIKMLAKYIVEPNGIIIGNADLAALNVAIGQKIKERITRSA